MEWLECIRKSIDYVEKHLLEVNGAEDLTDVVFMSPFYLQKGFKVLTGYTIGEYIRNRRLYLAALELAAGNCKVIDTAYKYKYETPESFTKAFTRFHGTAPSQLRNNTHNIRVFLPLSISVSIQGGSNMDYSVETMNSFELIGFKRMFSNETSYKEIPLFWDEVFDQYVKNWHQTNNPKTVVEKAVRDNHVGTYGICLDDKCEAGHFNYMVAGSYEGGAVPSEMVTYTVPAMQWAKFKCTGPIPGSLQSVNTKIFKEWLPANPDWELAAGFNIEWYSPEGSPNADDYHSEIWIPVKKR